MESTTRKEEQQIKNRIELKGKTTAPNRKCKETLRTKKLPNGMERNERKNTYGVKLAGFETWKSNHGTWSLVPRYVKECRHLKLTIGTQDKTKEEEDTRLTISL